MRPKSQAYSSVRADVIAFRLQHEIEPYDRPKIRGDCIDGQRPCPYVACKYHLGFEITGKGGLFKRFPDDPLGVDSESCVLDVADRGGGTLAEVAHIIGVSRERIRQIEEAALIHIRAKPNTDLDRDTIPAFTSPGG